MAVSASRIKEYTPSKVTLDAKDFSGKYLDLQSALETVSGVYICNMGGFGHYSDVSIRGSSPSQVQVYLDGIPLNGATGNAVDISKIPFSSLQTISIYKTTPPIEIFGDDAGGVIDLTTDTKKDETDASMELGSFGYREGSALIIKTIGPMVHRVSINYGYSENDYPYTDSVSTLGQTVSTDDSVKNMDNNFFSTVSSIYSNTFTINDYAKLTSQFSAIVTNEGIFYRPLAGSNDGNITNSKLSLIESYSTTIDSNISVTITAKGKTETEKFRRYRPFYLTPPDSAPLLHDICQPYGSIESVLKDHINGYLALTGFLSANYDGFDYNNLLWPAGQLKPAYSRITGKAGVEANVNFGKDVSARIGGLYRYEIDSTNDSMSSYGLPLPNSGRTKEGFPEAFSEFRYKILDGLGLLASVQYSSRSPGFSEKYSQGANVTGNDTLHPETRLEYNLGFSLLKSYMALSGSIFSSETKDKIVYIGHSMMFTPENVSNVNCLGLETDLTFTPFLWVSIGNSLTYMKNIIHSDKYAQLDGKDEPLLPRFIDNLNIKLIYKNWYASHSAHFSSQYFKDIGNTDPPVVIGPQLNASIGCVIGEHFDFSYRIENYLNIQDYDFQRPLPGLSQYIVLKCSL